MMAFRLPPAKAAPIGSLAEVANRGVYVRTRGACHEGHSVNLQIRHIFASITAEQTHEVFV